MHEALLDVGGRSVAVRDSGGRGPGVLLLHGAGGNLAHWDLVVPLLPDRFRLVSVDLPAHGASDVPERYSLAGDLAAVDAVRRSLGLRDTAVVGHSYGGMLAVALGAAGPDDYRLAVNLDGVGFGHPGTPEEVWSFWRDQAQERWLDSGDRAWRDEAVATELRELAEAGAPGQLPPEMVMRGFSRAADGRWHQAPPATHQRTLLRTVREVDLLERYAASRCPTVTVLASRRPAPTPELARAMAQHVDGIRAALAALPAESPAGRVLDVGSGHLVPLEVPEVAARLLAEALG